MPTGWRPDDMREKYPVFAIKDPYHFEKFDTPASRALRSWSWVQMFFNYCLLVYFFAYIGEIGSPRIFIYGAFIFISIYAYTELMDRNKNAMFLEIAKSALGLYLIYYLGDWFGARAHLAWFTYLVAAYLILSALISSWFVLFEIRKDEQKPDATLSMV